MRNGSSKGTFYIYADKASNNNPQNKLLKTQEQPKPSENMNNTNYNNNQNNKASDIPKIPSSKNGTSQKLDYNIQDNMTDSRIQEARVGLKLLKKKMSRNGMSREKVETLL